jgi:hypothetical protein
METKINGTLHADQFKFLVISRSVLLRMRNVSDKSYKENQNTHFVFSNFFPKISPFMRKCGAGQGTYNNMAHAHCMLDT